MRVNSKLISSLLLAVVAMSLQSCLKKELNQIVSGADSIDKTYNYTGFDFKTVSDYDVTLKALSPADEPIGGAYIEFFTANPVNADGSLKAERSASKVYNGITNDAGQIVCKISPAKCKDSLYVLTYYAGLPSLVGQKLTGSSISIQLGGASTNKSRNTLKGGTIPTPQLVNGYYVLGTWSNGGTPAYLEATNDVITSAFLKDVNGALPESSPVPTYHPEYLASANDMNLKVNANCELSVTFVSEGAGWTNALGYYTYPTNNPPASVNDIKDRTIIYPNISFENNVLKSGNKVKLYYLDKTTNKYTATFPAGVTVGWFLVAQGWASDSHTVKNTYRTHYSDTRFNAEANDNLKKHNVILKDAARSLLLMGFEDIPRDLSSCDQDFNDAIFYATATPLSAVNTDDLPPVVTPKDTDKDGVPDDKDEYPTDPKKAFNNYTPGSLVYEDLWPAKGDYDFNDMVLDYKFNAITNAQNNVVSIVSKVVLRAIGASYHNAFGIELNTTPANIASVTGQRNTKGYLNIAANGTENGQTKASIMFFDDAYSILPYPGAGSFVNTYMSAPFSKPDTLTVVINFVNPVSTSSLGTAPYNPFIVVNKNRGVEVHLPNNAPTSLADKKLFGTINDKSNSATGAYYVSDYYLPWAINIPVSFDYPTEKTDIRNAYLKFNAWAQSRGGSFADWYLNKSGYRNDVNIYSKKQ